jgi:hypothetical protein
MIDAGEQSSDQELVRQTRRRALVAAVGLVLLWLVLVAAMVVGAAQSWSGFTKGGARQWAGAAVVIVFGVVVIVAMMRSLRVIKAQPIVPSSSPAQRLRILGRIHRAVPVDDTDADLAQALAARMATGRARASAVAPIAGMLIGVAILAPGVLLDTALAASAVLLLLLAALNVRNAQRAERFLALPGQAD